jgi:hypothetical protein
LNANACNHAGAVRWNPWRRAVECARCRTVFLEMCPHGCLRPAPPAPLPGDVDSQVVRTGVREVEHGGENTEDPCEAANQEKAGN